MNLFKKHKTFKELLPDFLAEKETQVVWRSSIAYQSHSRAFLSWLKRNNYDNLPMRKLTSEIVAEFFKYLVRVKKLDKSTCEKYFLNLRVIFKYAQKWGEVDRLPFDLVVFPQKKADGGAEVIRPDDLVKLLTTIKEKDTQLYLACMMEYYCFIRPGNELLHLKIGDIDLDRGIITINEDHAKNHKKQIVTMPNQLIEICKEYGIDKADKTLYVFGKKKRFSTRTICSNNLPGRFNEIRDRLGMSKGYKLYSFKHTGASALHLSGISMRELMDQLRHTKLDATQHYLKKHSGLINERIRDNFPDPLKNTI